MHLTDRCRFLNCSVRMGGWGVEGFVKNTLYPYVPDSEPTKLLDYPKQKPRRGGRLTQKNTCRPFTGQFFK
jgi:hypothetical protein